MTKVLTSLDRAEVDRLKVVEWRLRWLRAGGFSTKAAEKLAQDEKIDWRFANDLLKNAGEKGFDEKFVMNLLL